MINAEPSNLGSAEARAAMLRNKGRGFLAAQQPKAAQFAFQRALLLTPRDAATVVNLATLQPNPPEIAAAMRRGFILAPNDPKILANLAISNAAKSDCAAALSYWRRLAVYTPSNSKAAFGLLNGWIPGQDQNLRWHGYLVGGAKWLNRGLILDPERDVPVDFIIKLGFKLKIDGHESLALSILKLVGKVTPLSSAVNSVLARWFFHQGDWLAATSFLKRSLIMTPSGKFAFRNFVIFGHCSGLVRNYQDAFKSFLRATLLSPEQFLAIVPHLANASFSRPSCSRTWTLARMALTAEPNKAVVYQNFSGLHSAAGEFCKFARLIRCASIADPKIDLRVNLGTYMLRTARPFAAWAYYDAAAKADPANLDAVCNRAKMLLAFGDIKAGISYLRDRWKLQAFDAPHQLYPVPSLPIPVWRGQPIAGKRIFVWGEQGIGDDLWFLGRMNDLINQQADITLECSPKIFDILKLSFPGIRVYPRSYFKIDPEEFDYQIPVGFLTEEYIANSEKYPSGYLKVDRQMAHRLRQKYKADWRGPVVGVSWRSIKPAAGRSYEAPISEWGGLLGIKNFKFVSLQYGDIDKDTHEAERLFGATIHKDAEVEYDGSLKNAAAQIAAVDAVVSIASTPIILANGLSVPTWAALRRYQEDWRYTIGRNETDWLPHCRLFWPTESVNWGDVIMRIGGDLMAHFEKK